MRFLLAFLAGLVSAGFGLATAFVGTALYAKFFPGTLMVSQDPNSQAIGLLALFSVLAWVLGLGGFAGAFVVVWRNFKANP